MSAIDTFRNGLGAILDGYSDYLAIENAQNQPRVEQTPTTPDPDRPVPETGLVPGVSNGVLVLGGLALVGIALIVKG